MGGGAMMDIGCYCLSLARYLFGKEPLSIIGKVDWDKAWGTDRISSGIINFDKGTSTFTCSTQIMPYQRVQIIGTSGRIEIEIPFNAPPDKPTKLWLHTSEGTKETIFPITDQYTLEADAFAQSIVNNTQVPTPLEDSIQNMKLMEAFFKSAEEGREVKL
jgi:predicted dehydrogenase